MNLLKISEIMKEAQENMFSGDFMRVIQALSKIKNELRETIQELTSDEIRIIIDKLEKGEFLTSRDLECLRLWIIGDAESYSEMENNFDDWLNEFTRLQNVLKEYENKELSLEELFKLQGIIEDASRVAGDIKNFLEKKEQIKNFETAIKNPQDLDREVLLYILKTKLTSPEI